MGLFDMFKKEEPKPIKLLSPSKGIIKPITEATDPVFSQKMMGDGFLINPKDSAVVAPMSGTLSVVYETGHAYGITADNGLEILVHVGIDTVELKGAPFKMQVKQGDKVQAGNLLVEADFASIKDAGMSPDVLVLFPTLDAEGKKLELIASGEVEAGVEVAEVK